jgi:hypothetical protein
LRDGVRRAFGRGGVGGDAYIRGYIVQRGGVAARGGDAPAVRFQLRAPRAPVTRAMRLVMSM